MSTQNTIQPSEIKSDQPLDGQKYLTLLAQSDIQGLLQEKYLSLELDQHSYGIEIIDLNTGHSTFSCGFNVILKNHLTGDVYEDDTSGCMIEVKDQPNRYTFSGSGFMKNCQIIYNQLTNTYEIGDSRQFLDLVTQPPIVEEEYNLWIWTCMTINLFIFMIMLKIIFTIKTFLGFN